VDVERGCDRVVKILAASIGTHELCLAALPPPSDSARFQPLGDVDANSANRPRIMLISCVALLDQQIDARGASTARL